MLNIRDPRISDIIRNALETNSFIPLEKTTPCIYRKSPPMTVFIGRDPQGRIKTIIVKDEIFDWVFGLEIVNPGKELCEMWDFGRFKPVGFKGKLIYKNRIGPGIIAGSHYHKKKKELFFVLSKGGKLTFSFTRVKDQKKIEVELDASTIEIDGMRYSLALYLNPGIAHDVANHGKRNRILLAVVADRSHNSSDDYRLEDN